MLNAIAIIGIIFVFCAYEVLLRFVRLVAPGESFANTQAFVRRSVRHIFSILKAYCRVELEFENRSGHELPARFLLVANHQSLLDIPVCIALFPEHRLRFVAKRELGDGIPFVSFILRKQGHALIRRQGDASQSMRTIKRFAKRCSKENTCPVIFPEGTRSRDGQLGTFHTAGVRKILEIEAVPIVVAVIEGSWRVGKIGDAFKNLQGTKFQVRVLSITEAMDKKKDILDTLARAREDIDRELTALRSKLVGSQ
jgi:1-acyl-sn-glycerol-3-phosphate acyltransferase